MLAAVVPARNEANRIGIVLRTLLDLPVAIIIPVLNGCTDRTEEVVSAFVDRTPRCVLPVRVSQPMGLDIPRAAGANVALRSGATAVLFIDGDTGSDLGGELRQLCEPVNAGTLDMSLTNCYVDVPQDGLVGEVAGARFELNRALGLDHLGASSPSHGPHAVSRRLLQSLPLRELGMPPVTEAMAVMAGLKIDVGAYIPHHRLHSAVRPLQHRVKVGHTIIGDCLEALAVVEGRRRTRIKGGKEYQGFNQERRWDLLERFLARQ